MTPVDDRQQASERAGGRAVLAVLLVLALLAGGGYAAAYLLAGDNVPRGTTVAGVDIGGRSRPAARAALRAGLADRVDRPIAVTVDGARQSVTPSEAGLSVDYAASVAEAGGGRSRDPPPLWNYYTRGDDPHPVVDVDEAAMDAAVVRLAGQAGTPPVDGAVDFRNGRVRVTRPRAGEELDPDAARAAIEAAYLSDGATPDLPLRTAQPDIDAGDVQRVLDDFANPALSAPVTLIFGDSRVRLTPRRFGAVLGTRAEGGALVPDLDEQRLTALVADAVSADGAPVDATVALVHGRPRVVRAKPGVTYDPADVTGAFLELVARQEGRREMKV